MSLPTVPVNPAVLVRGFISALSRPVPACGFVCREASEGRWSKRPNDTQNFAQKCLLHRSLCCIVGCKRLSFLIRWCLA
jgi:hypothetical protein